MIILEPTSLSPDPTRTRRGRAVSGNRTALDVHPSALIAPAHPSGPLRAWARRLRQDRPMPPLAIPESAISLREIALDFGTEVEAALEVRAETSEPCNVCVLFGESPLEIAGVALPPNVPHVPLPAEHRYLCGPGVHRLIFEPRGFRFVRIVVPDSRRPVVLRQVTAHAVFACRSQEGDFHCDFPLLQRTWQTSLYTARLCTRPEAFWDGIKRDRVGWYGDARITQQTLDTAFSDPTPALRMLLALPIDRWANEIPSYSFDGIAMLRQVILRHGIVPETQEIYARVRRMMAWAQRTHVNCNGFFVRNDRSQYFFGIGFVDWSAMPIGGRFEEIAWMQFRWLEALRLAADVARLLGRTADAGKWRDQADRLAPRLLARFYRPGAGFVHTLNRSARAWDKPSPERDYRTTYVDRIRLGPSGPSRHSAALAVWAGLCRSPHHRRAVLRTLNDPSVAPVVTPYFAWYEQSARAECGDIAGAMERMLSYVGRQVIENDSACVWESYEPEITDFRKWGLHRWPKSLCHGWSSGVVPMTTRYLLGVRPVAPGFAAVELRPSPDLPWRFDAVIPTPRGPIRARRDKQGGIVRYRLPRDVRVETTGGECSIRQ